MATVREIRGGTLVVEAESPGACAGCGGCAARARHPCRLEVDGRGLAVAVGDTVRLFPPAGDLVRAAAVLYLAPLAGFGAGVALLSAAGGGHPGWLALGGAAGLAAGLLCARWLERRLRQRGHFHLQAVKACSE